MCPKGRGEITVLVNVCRHHLTFLQSIPLVFLWTTQCTRSTRNSDILRECTGRVFTATLFKVSQRARLLTKGKPRAILPYGSPQLAGGSSPQVREAKDLLEKVFCHLFSTCLMFWKVLVLFPSRFILPSSFLPTTPPPPPILTSYCSLSRWTCIREETP